MKAPTSTIATDDAARLAVAGELLLSVQTVVFDLQAVLSDVVLYGDDKGEAKGASMARAALTLSNVVGAMLDQGRALCDEGRFHRAWLAWLSQDDISDRLAALAPKGGEA